jgi:hypothetical protein
VYEMFKRDREREESKKWATGQRKPKKKENTEDRLSWALLQE